MVRLVIVEMWLVGPWLFATCAETEDFVLDSSVMDVGASCVGCELFVVGIVGAVVCLFDVADCELTDNALTDSLSFVVSSCVAESNKGFLVVSSNVEEASSIVGFSVSLQEW